MVSRSVSDRMRLIFFISVLLIGAVLPWWLFIIIALVYGLAYGGEELLVIGFVLDMLYGNPVPWLPIPLVYTFALSGLLLFLWGIKPLLSVHSTKVDF